MIRIGILGATGYTALELIKLLLRHPEAKITALTSRQQGEPHVAAIHPALVGRLDLRLRDLNPEQVAAECDCVFSCLPHGASAQAVKPLVEAGVRVVDFSADYRLNDLAVYRAGTKKRTATPSGWGRSPTGCPSCSPTRLRVRRWSPIPAVIPRRPFWRWRRCSKAGWSSPPASFSIPRAASPARDGRPS